MNKFTLSQLITAFKLIREERIRDNCGICANLNDLVDLSRDSSDFFVNLMKSWPKFSGFNLFPVSDWGSYHQAVVNGTLWDKSTDEGRLRFELLDYLIETCEALYNGACNQ